MGEFQERQPAEVAKRYSRPLPESWQAPAEIVREYRRPEPEAIVLSYRRPLPEGHPAFRKKLEMREVILQGRADLECRSMSSLREETASSLPPDDEEDEDDDLLLAHYWKLNRRQPRKSRKGLLVFAACIAVLVGITAAAGLLRERRQIRDGFEHSGDHYEWSYEDDENLPKEITIPRWPVGQGAALSVVRDHGEALSAQEIYRRVNPSVVTVLAEIDGSRMSVGTGVVFSGDGYLITNHHVVEGGQDCTVVLDTGLRCEARFVASDARQDLAVLKIVPEDLPENLPAAEFGDSDLLTVGDPVYAIGNPLGFELRGTLTDGIVSAINRNVEVDGRNMTLIQTNAALNSGNSGGPLINAYGQVVGINVIKMRSNYSTVEGLGFAIPAALMERMVNDLLTWGELQPEPVLGVQLLRLPETLAEGVQGLKVQEVTSGSPADDAGVRPGDYVLKAGGEPVSSSQEVLRIRRQLHLGDQLVMTIWREGETFDVILELDQAVDE